MHFLVEHVKLARDRPADRALVSEPLGAVAHRQTHAFGGAVIFVDDRPPPADHRLFHRHGTGRGAVNRSLERTQVVTAAHGFRQFEHPREHRRHQLGVGHAVFLDEMQELLFVKPLHDDERPPQSNRSGSSDKRRRMVEGRRHQIGHALAKPPVIHVAREDRVWLGQRLIVERP